MLNDPAVASVVVDRSAPAPAARPANNGRMYITLKPWDQRNADVMQVIARLDQDDGRPSPASGCSCNRRRTSASAPGLARTLYQYTLQDPNQAELNQWAPKILAKMQQHSAAGRCHLRPGEFRHHRNADLSIATRPRASASSRRRSTPSCTTRSGSARSRSTSPATRPTTSSSRRCRTSSAISATLQKLYVHVDDRRGRAAVDAACTKRPCRCSRSPSTTRASSPP